MASGAAPPTDLHGWWHVFSDPELDRLVDRALTANLEVGAAVERLRAARALHDRASARYLPSFRLATRDVVEPSANASYLFAGFDANWEFGLFGRGEGTRREAAGDLDAALADLHAAQVSLVAETVRSWIELRAAQAQEQALTRISQSRQDMARVMDTRRRLHLASAGVAAQARAAWEQSQAALAIPREAINANAHKLATLLGQNEPDPGWLIPGPQPSVGAWSLTSTPADLVRTRPDIARAEADVLQAAGRQAVAHADLFPSIGIGGSIDWATDFDSSRPHWNAQNGITSLGPVIDIPLFDWGIRLARKHASDHALTATVLKYRQTVLLGVSEVESALGSLQQQQLRERRSANALHSIEQADRAVQARRHLRMAGALEEADSRIAVEQGGIALMEARTGHALAYVALFKALGGAPRPATGQPATPANPPVPGDGQP